MAGITGAASPFFPTANTQDGLLDVCVFEKVGYVDLFRYLHGIVTKSHTQLPDVRYFKAETLRVRSEKFVPMEVDGELHGGLPAIIGVEKKALKVLVP